MNNLPVLHIYTPIEFLLITGFYRSIQSEERTKKRLSVIAILFVMAAFINVIFFQSIYEMNSWVRASESLLVIFFSLLVWIHIMRQLNIDRLTDAGIFWFNSAFLIYFSVNIILFLVSRQLNKLPVEEVIQPWFVHCVFMTLYYLLLSMGLCKRQTQ